MLELERRAGLLDRSGTARLGLAGYRARTGEQLGRVVVVVDGLLELFGADDAVAAASRRALRRLSEDGPAVGRAPGAGRSHRSGRSPGCGRSRAGRACPRR